MKTNKFIIAVLALFISAGAWAQVNIFRPLNDKTFFVGEGMGINVGFDGNKYEDRDKSHIGPGLAMEVYGGFWLSESMGVRAGIAGYNISDKFTDFGQYNYLYLHGDMILKSGNGFFPYVHLGYAHANKGTVAGGVGAMFPIYVTKYVAVVPDLKVSAMRGKAFNDNAASIGAAFTGSIGIYVSIERN